MKLDDFIIKKNNNVTYLISLKDSKEIYEFTNSSKIIIDNIEKTQEEVINILINKYNIEYEKAKKSYINFINSLSTINTTNEIKNITFSDLQKNINKDLNQCTIEITNVCPFRCKHCYVPKNDKIFMSFEMFKKIIDELKEINCNWILLTGGEPMSNPNFIKMYTYAKENGFFVSLNTTTYLLNDKILELFNKYKPDVLEISLYGYNHDSYKEFVKVDDSFEKVIENIKQLKDNNQNIKLKTVITKSNVNSFVNIRNLAKELNIPFRYDYIIFPKLGELNKQNEELLSPKEIIEIIKTDQSDIDYFKRQVEEIEKLKDKDNEITKLFQCALGKDRIFIDTYGNIKLCLVVPHSLNINNISIKEAINLLNKKIDGMLISEKSKCKNCYKKKICRYCPGRFFLETGVYDLAPDFYCTMADELIKEFK